jgi:hypothetical protein
LGTRWSLSNISTQTVNVLALLMVTNHGHQRQHSCDKYRERTPQRSHRGRHQGEKTPILSHLNKNAL